LPPVDPDELLGDRRQRKGKWRAAVVASLDGEIGDREQERVFVARAEVSFGEKPLQLQQNLDLPLLGRRAHFDGRVGS
jgi:hypothetical protein